MSTENLSTDSYFKCSLQHCGGKTYEAGFARTATAEDLITHIENLTQLPRYQLKIIFRGKTILDDMGTLIDLKFPQVGGKLMIVGRKMNPEEDAIMKKLTEMMKTSKKYNAEVLDQIETYEKSVLQNHLPKDLHEECYKNVVKRLRYCAEQQIRSLETLDAMTIKADFNDAKRLKKSTTRQIQAWLDEADKQLSDIEAKAEN